MDFAAALKCVQAVILQLDTSTLSRNVKPLQAHGWLEVVPDEDTRAQPFRLAPQGKRLIEKAAPAWKGAQRQATELLGSSAPLPLEGSSSFSHPTPATEEGARPGGARWV